jgi:hypothetical protein
MKVGKKAAHWAASLVEKMVAPSVATKAVLKVDR